MLQQQWPWLTPSGQPPEMSAASHLLISYTLLLYLTSKIVSPCWCTSVVYHNSFSVLKEKCVKPCGKFRDVLLFALQTLTSLLYFFLLEKSSWLLYIVIMLMMTMITYLLTVQGALLPACVCMKGVLTVWQNGGGCDEDDDLGSVCYCYNVECFFCFFLSTRDSWGVCMCVCACALLNTYLLQSGKWNNVNLTACICRERVCVWMCTCVLDWILWWLKVHKHWHYCICLLSCFFSSIFFLFVFFSVKCNKRMTILFLRQSNQLKAFLFRCQILPYQAELEQCSTDTLKTLLVIIYCFFFVMYQFKLSQSLLSLLFRMSSFISDVTKWRGN